jgi:hypothetical protein
MLCLKFVKENFCYIEFFLLIFFLYREEELERPESEPPPSYSSLHVEESPPSYAEAITKC